MIIRVSKADNPFAQIDKTPINDTRLSWKAKGILTYLLSKPDDWTVRVTDLIRRANDGEAAVRSGLRELRDCGYLKVKQDRKPDGTFAPAEYTIYEHPRPLGGKPHADNPQAGNPHAENRPITNTDSTNNTNGPEKPSGQEPIHQEKQQPKTFPQWHERVMRAKNKAAALQRMFVGLFPGRDPPEYGYIGRTAKTVGGPGRLAELLWNASTRPPTGDVLRYCMGAAKGQAARGEKAKPVETLNGKRIIEVPIR